MRNLAEEAAARLGPEGPVAAKLLRYEVRGEQVRMTAAAAETFEFGGVRVVEAGTGTGKSLAYLVPAVLWAVAQDERVIISTATINLQQQLIRTDLPLLAESLGIEFRSALLKGRGNYFCLRKAAEVKAEPKLLDEAGAEAELRSIFEWAEDTDDGSIADLGFVPRGEVWGQVAAEYDDCLRNRCPEYERCFFYQARNRAAAAHVLVVNHHLLLADLALRDAVGDDTTAGVVPAASRVVLDEAHHVDAVATEHFGGKSTSARLERVLSRLQHSSRPERGVLPALARRLEAKVDGSESADAVAAEGARRLIRERLGPRVRSLGEEVRQVFDELLLSVDALANPSGGNDTPTVRVVESLVRSELWASVTGRLGHLIERLTAFAAEIAPVLDRLDGLSEESAEDVAFHAQQLRAAAGRVEAAAGDLSLFCAAPEALCCWFEIGTRGRRGPELALRSAPVRIGEQLRHSLFGRFESVVMTSATLAVDRRFEHFLERCGLGDGLDGRVDTLRLDSPFDYDRQALLVVPSDLPAPDAPGAAAALHRAIDELVRASGGGAFVLFTSYRALERAHRELAGALDDAGFSVLRQGELSRHALLERFRRDGNAVLFATDSFWEGVDVRGAALRNVILARLPFRVPTEPLQQARAEEVEAQGGNAFGDFSLPQAVIRFRQGFGRLIRTRDDRGVIAVLDSRVVNKRYGRIFLDSVPRLPTTVAPLGECRDAVTAFFDSQGRRDMEEG